MVKGQTCPWLLNARVKLGTELMPGSPPGLLFALDWPRGAELLKMGPERRDRGVANPNLEPNLAPGNVAALPSSRRKALSESFCAAPVAAVANANAAAKTMLHVFFLIGTCTPERIESRT
jgi:hypothetical protein